MILAIYILSRFGLAVWIAGMLPRTVNDATRVTAFVTVLLWAAFVWIVVLKDHTAAS